MEKTFLDAQWRKLAMANYIINPEILKPYVPAYTELDFWEGNCYVSLVGFMFLETKVLGLKVPFHTNFEEVNLRFYVKHKGSDGEWRRGVVFIKEIVPKSAITLIANILYKENYVTYPMKHTWENSDTNIRIEYSWKHKRQHLLSVLADATPLKLKDNSEEEFITEHFWGYAKKNDLQTNEYQVEHPRWDTYKVISHMIDIDFGLLYGGAFANLTTQTPHSVLLAEGSRILVRQKRTLSSL